MYKGEIMNHIIPREKLINTDFSCFTNLLFDEAPFIQEVIKEVGWGSNRIIRQQGFKVQSITIDLQHIRLWSIIRDPRCKIPTSMFISKLKGQSVIVVHVGAISQKQ
jgi:hypothetical protein